MGQLKEAYSAPVITNDETSTSSPLNDHDETAVLDLSEEIVRIGYTYRAAHQE